MTRRIVRTAVQLALLTVLALISIIILDSRYRVLPTSIHGFLPAHHIGYVVTDITVSKCSTTSLFSKCSVDGPGWHRVEKELYLGQGWVSSAYLHVQRKKEEELVEGDSVVLGVRVGRTNPAIKKGGKTKGGHTDLDAEGEEGEWESRPGGIWLLRTTEKALFNSDKVVTGIDVLFGADAVDPRTGWEIKDTPLLLSTSSSDKHNLEARLSVKKGAHKAHAKPVPRIQDNGKFKIMQVADLHLATGLGVCRDPMPQGVGRCDADTRTLEFVGRLLDEERPNLVVLSGDQVNGDTSPDAQSAIFKYAELFIKRSIPFATIFGNHDDEGPHPLSRASQMAIVESLPFSLSQAGPSHLSGVGNYYIEILARGTSSHSALTLYLLDTHAYSPDEQHYKGYDWLKKDQVDWFKTTADGLKKKHKEYTGIHMNLAFIHIPLPEYRDESNVYVGEWREGVTAPGFNSGFRDALVEEDVKFVSCGHDHANEYCMLSRNAQQSPALWMCYGGGAGFGGYGGYGGYHRRVRFFDIDMNDSRITTYKRLEWGEVDKRIDEQIIVNDGKVVEPIASPEMEVHGGAGGK